MIKEISLTQLRKLISAYNDRFKISNVYKSSKAELMSALKKNHYSVDSKDGHFYLKRSAQHARIKNIEPKPQHKDKMKTKPVKEKKKK
tara:strand:- start:5038 stop:5301 length:264 start_codon:yes stop_codon:yes gene_type:complete